MSARLYYGQLPNPSFTLIEVFETEEAAKARASELSRGAKPVGRTGSQSLSGNGDRGFAYHLGNEQWIVEVEDH